MPDCEATMIERDDNLQQQFEHHQEEEWYEYNRRLLDGFDEIRPVIEGERATLPQTVSAHKLEKET